MEHFTKPHYEFVFQMPSFVCTWFEWHCLHSMDTPYTPNESYTHTPPIHVQRGHITRAGANAQVKQCPVRLPSSCMDALRVENRVASDAISLWNLKMCLLLLVQTMPLCHSRLSSDILPHRAQLEWRPRALARSAQAQSQTPPHKQVAAHWSSVAHLCTVTAWFLAPFEKKKGIETMPVSSCRLCRQQAAQTQSIPR